MVRLYIQYIILQYIKYSMYGSISARQRNRIMIITVIYNPITTGVLKLTYDV